MANSTGENAYRFDGGTSGHYEVWFVTLNDPVSGWGFWFRYAVDVPVGTDVPRPSLWASVFPRDGDPPFGIAKAFDPGAWQSPDELLGRLAGVGDAALFRAHLDGAVSDERHTISWDLGFDPAAETFHHVDPSVQRLVRPKSIICAPNLAVEFSGTVEVDGRRFVLERAPGCQQHLWGRKHAESWAWAHCNAFDREPGVAFEALSARTLLGGVTLPPLTLAYLRFGVEEYRFNGLRNLVTASSRTGDFEWHFTSRDARTRLVGEAHTSAERFLQAVYPDPDGDMTFCLNTEIGDLTLTLERRTSRFGAWESVRTFVSTGTTHFELASRRERPGIPRISRTG